MNFLKNINLKKYFPLIHPFLCTLFSLSLFSLSPFSLPNCYGLKTLKTKSISEKNTFFTLFRNSWLICFVSLPFLSFFYTCYLSIIAISVYLYFYLAIYPSIYISIYLSIYLYYVCSIKLKQLNET